MACLGPASRRAPDHSVRSLGRLEHSGTDLRTTGRPSGARPSDRARRNDAGRNSRNSIGYYSPQPPVGDPPHRYSFQVLALDTVLELPLGSDRDQVLAAAKNHVSAKGELTDLYQQWTQAAEGRYHS